MPTQVRANRVVTYATNPHASEQARARDNTDNLIQYKDNQAYNGTLSKAAAKRIKEIVPNMALIAGLTKAAERYGKRTKIAHLTKQLTKKKTLLTFITLTLASEQQHTDNEIKRDCLQPFLAELKRKKYLALYLWVAETQKNGNIHFHIVTNAYIKKEVVRNLWNYHQNALGYIDRCKYTNPPSTKIEGCKSVTNVSRYICKYLCKNDNQVTDNTANPDKERRKVEGRLWGCDTVSEQLVGVVVPAEATEQVYQETNTSTTFCMEDKHYSLFYIDITKAPTIIQILLESWHFTR